MDYAYESILPNQDLPFTMFRFEGMNGNYVREKHWHREIELFTVFSGELTFTLGDRTRSLAASQTIIVNSNEVHAIRAPKPNNTLVVQIPLQLFSDYLSVTGMISFRHSLPEKDPELIRLLRELYDVYNRRDYGYRLRALSLFYELQYQLITYYRKEVISPELVHQNRNLNRLSRITDYIAQNYAQDLSLEALARTFNYSPTYLAHMFRKYAGTTFKAYLQNLRLEHARRQMEETDEALGTIALANGFASSKAFAHVFQQQYGILPSQYPRSRE